MSYLEYLQVIGEIFQDNTDKKDNNDGCYAKVGEDNALNKITNNIQYQIMSHFVKVSLNRLIYMRRIEDTVTSHS